MKTSLLREKVAVIFFVLYFLVGMSVLKDFGVSWDELYQDTIGHFNVRYVMRMDTHLLDSTNTSKFTAPLYEMFVVATSRALGLNSEDYIASGQGSIYFRHFLNFSTFFIGVIFFYLICRRRFKSIYIGLFGATMLIVTPRLFSDEFYNSKDSVFLAFFVITFYLLIKFLEKKSLIRLIGLAILTGITFGIRVGVVFIPFFAVLSFVGDYFFIKRASIMHKRDLRFLLLYGFITLSIIFATYPVLWSNPIHNFINIMQFFSRQPNNVPNLYFGAYVPAFDIPWHFIPVWMTITTPPVYLMLFVTGLFSLILSLKKNVKQFYLTRREDVLFLLWFFFPLAAVMVTHSVLYNSWRHMFFIFPAFIIIAIHGVLYIKEFAQRYIPATIVIFVLSLLLISNFVFVAYEMIALHPYEHLYFNFLAGSDMKSIRKQFDTDYWGLTYRKGLEFIVQYDKSPSIGVIADFPGHSNSFILPERDRLRVFAGFPWDINDIKPKYFMTNFFFSQKEFPYKEIYAVNVKGADILKVYELPDSEDIRFDGKFIYR